MELTAIVVEVQIPRSLIPRRPWQAGIRLLEPVPHPGASFGLVPVLGLLPSVWWCQATLQVQLQGKREQRLGVEGPSLGPKRTRTRHSAATPAARCPGTSTAWFAS